MENMKSNCKLCGKALEEFKDSFTHLKVIELYRNEAKTKFTATKKLGYCFCQDCWLKFEKSFFNSSILLTNL